MANILITGATGFLGRNLCEHLSNQGHKVKGTVRAEQIPSKINWETTLLPSIDDNADWLPHLKNIDVVIHCAATNSDQGASADSFNTINVLGSKRLAAQAIEANVKKFIFLSSAKVYGENSPPNTAFIEKKTLSPPDAYALSKANAEEQLNSLEFGQTQLLILRPPLIYGPGMKGNFLSLLKLCSKSIPLPFGLANQRRSFLYIGNLLCFIQHVITNSEEFCETVNICDPSDLTLKELTSTLRSLMHRAPRQLPIPTQLFLLLATILRKRSAYDRLFGPLCIDSAKAGSVFTWAPTYTTAEGLKLTVEHYRGKLF